ncbi:MAG: 50S ribosomal protein L6 [Chloroflexi bacterium]|nr:50S ribosomal protein L6 [Chloroflexota bacterium]
MSRIGNKPIPIPKGVQVNIGAENQVTVKGTLGTLTQALPAEITVTVEDGVIRVRRPSDQRQHKALHGLSRALLSNMVTGVAQGYQKTLELVGVGYRIQQSGNKVVLQVGFSHPVEMEPPAGVTVKVEGANRVVISGCDKQQVGQVAAEIRAVKPPDPYKGKGIRYAGEVVRLKPGKAAARKT